MSGMKRSHFFRIMSTVMVVLLVGTAAMAAEANKKESNLPSIDIGGAYLGLFNTISQEESADTDDKRTQFDYAANLDFSIQFGDQVSGFVQLQGGPGDGSLGLAGPTVVVTDVFITYHHPDHPLDISFGSYDTPFAYETKFQNNNGAALAHPLILNSLFFSGFAEGPITTLNSLGLKAEYTPEYFDLTGAITNGTGQTADNADGNFEFILGGGVRPVKNENLRIGAAYLISDDRQESGVTGKGTEFEAWLLEGHFVSDQGLSTRAFVGQMTFKDDIDATEDKVTCLTGELAYTDNSWHIAGRFSTWTPDDDNGTGGGIAGAIPNPGLAITQGGQPVYRDQKVSRIQFGGGYQLFSNVMLKAEYFLDNYDRSSDGVSTDVNGLIISFAGAF